MPFAKMPRKDISVLAVTVLSMLLQISLTTLDVFVTNPVNQLSTLLSRHKLIPVIQIILAVLTTPFVLIARAKDSLSANVLRVLSDSMMEAVVSQLLVMLLMIVTRTLFVLTSSMLSNVNVVQDTSIFLLILK